MADDTDLEAEIAAATRSIVCSVCEWLEGRDDAERWDRIMASSVKVYGHSAITAVLKRHGFTPTTAKPVESHRNRGHRVT